jgi:aspartate dehydrogenase
MELNSVDVGNIRKIKKVAVLGCGAIGSRIARSIKNELQPVCSLSGLYDIDTSKSAQLEQSISQDNLVKESFPALLQDCDILVEAINSDTRNFIQQALESRKDVLTMSVGKLLNAEDLFALSLKNGCAILIPSGAVAGIDAVKSASLAPIKRITLTTRKPVSGFSQNRYIEDQGINLGAITGETCIFEGTVDDAVRLFPRNINVAATLALASHAKSKIVIRILTSPEYTINSHEIDIQGDFGHMVSRTENVICPDNPKTSYLAVLSAIQTLKEFCSGVRIGT